MVRFRYELTLFWYRMILIFHRYMVSSDPHPRGELYDEFTYCIPDAFIGDNSDHMFQGDNSHSTLIHFDYPFSSFEKPWPEPRNFITTSYHQLPELSPRMSVISSFFLMMLVFLGCLLLTSGSSWAAVLGKRNCLSFPADLYLEGTDQHRGWFQSSLLTSIATRGSRHFFMFTFMFILKIFLLSLFHSTEDIKTHSLHLCLVNAFWWCVFLHLPFLIAYSYSFYNTFIC